MSDASGLPAVLRRERGRADRAGSGFCVVLFGLRGEALDEEGVAGLWEIVSRRARETDELAVVGGRLVCTVLPDTPPEGARRFAKDVFASLNGQAGRARVEILSYPSAPAVEDPGRGSAAFAARGGINDGDGGNGTDDGQSLLSQFLRHIATEAASAYPDAQTLHSAFIAPLPRWKRAMDVAVAAAALACLAPVMAIIAAAIGVTAGGPVIFKQRRAGLLGRPFDIYKFRTMVVGAERQQAELRQRSEQDGPAFKLTNDPRVTRLGRFLRKTSLDELPQLWNVLRGDMSLVGPRPLPCAESSGCTGWQSRRLYVTPGITCIWQVKGRSQVSFQEWMRMDIAYVRTRRLLRDVQLLLLTVPAVLLRRGAR